MYIKNIKNQKKSFLPILIFTSYFFKSKKYCIIIIDKIEIYVHYSILIADLVSKYLIE